MADAVANLSAGTMAERKRSTVTTTKAQRWTVTTRGGERRTATIGGRRSTVKCARIRVLALLTEKCTSKRVSAKSAANCSRILVLARSTETTAADSAYTTVRESPCRATVKMAQAVVGLSASTAAGVLVQTVAKQKASSTARETA